MAGAMADFGVDADTLGRALFKLSKNIANGDDGVADALLTMGLSIEQVKNMRGEELFLTIQNGLATLNGSLRDTTAVTLYGEKLGMAMAGASKGTQQAVEDFRKFNTVMSKDTVEALDSASEAITKMEGSLKAIAANAIGPVAEGFNTLISTMNKGASTWQIVVAMAKDFAASNSISGASTTNLATLIDQLNQTQQANIKTTDAATEAATKNAKAQDDQAGATKRNREAAAGLKDFEAQTKAMKDQQDIVDGFVAKRDAAAIQKAKDDAAELDATAKKTEAAKGYIKAIGEFVTKQNESAAANKALIDEQERLNAENDAAIQKLNEVGKAHTDAGNAAKAGTDQAVAGYAGVTQQIEISGDAIRAWLALMQYTAQANAILSRNSLFTSSGQYEQIGRIPIPSFAGGVTDFPGGLAKVHQDELLVNLPPGTSVIPKGAGGGTNVSNVFHLVDSESNLARRVSEMIMRSIRAGTQLGTA
jgi:hypothetical protein